MSRKKNDATRPCVVCAVEHVRAEPCCSEACQNHAGKFLPTPDREGLVDYWCWHGPQPRWLAATFPGEGRVYSPICDRWHSPAPIPRSAASGAPGAAPARSVVGGALANDTWTCEFCGLRFGGKYGLTRHRGTGLARGQRGPVRCLTPDEWTAPMHQDAAGVWRRQLSGKLQVSLAAL